MKQLIVGVVLVILIGIGAFVYRNALEHPATQMPEGQACTMEAKICPDGSSVGRTGPNCEFAACPTSSRAVDEEIGISFSVPAGFTANADAIGADPSLRSVFDSTVLPVGGIPNSVIIRRFPIPAGKTANDVIIANTMHETSGMPAESMSEFKPIIVNGKTYQSITTERFEAIIHTEYYLARGNDVLRFEALDRDVMDWTDVNLKLETLPAHKAMLDLLSTLQSTP